MPRLPFQRSRQVVYTCLFGYSEPFLDQDDGDPGIDHICFTDDPDLVARHWQIVYRPDPALDPARLSKRYKHLPHLFLATYDRSLYIDNTVLLKATPSQILARFDREPMVMVRHPWRDCIYDEAEEVKRAGMDDAAIVDRQMAAYRRLGFPARAGLHAATVMVRDHRVREIARIGEEWHCQMLIHSKRDQLSFDYVAWRHGFQPTPIDEDLMDNSLFRWPHNPSGVRVPRNFDDTAYLARHPDVAAAGIPARKHYLLHGLREAAADRSAEPMPA